MTDSLRPDLNDTLCSSSACLAVADTLGQAHLLIPVITGAPDRRITLVVPLCIEHAHLLRMGAELVDLDVGFS